MSKLPGLNGIRACACLMIILHHLSQTYNTSFTNPDIEFIHHLCLSSLQSCVTIFFVLSGALLSRRFWLQYLDDKVMPNLHVFFIHRAARIIPAFYSVLAITFLLELFIIPEQPNRFLRFFSAFTFLSGFNYKTFFPTMLDGPLWSISFEVVTYILLPVFMFGLFFSQKHYKHHAVFYWILALITVLLINNVIQIYCQPDDINRGWQYGIVGGAKYWMPNYNPIGFFAQYMLGIAAAGITIWLERASKIRGYMQKHNLFDILSLLGISTYIIMLFFFSTIPEFAISMQNQPYHYPLFSGCAALIITVMPLSKHIGHLFDNPFFSYTAKISFGLYIWHYIFVAAIFYSGATRGTGNITDWFIGSLVVIIAAYTVASLSWFLLEKPILDRVKNYCH
ncbi:acyltransferase family protein [Pectinatus frisingensis]|uniref:acyltransferase family protein n=1 Tax=Pectinatus frisingensis TaxID=865 RepID=UPI0018C78F04|nr:acyltransferase [Pectinatus frisingensis]